MNPDVIKYMKLAIEEAKKAEAVDEVPIGCIIVKDGTIIGKGYNLRESNHSATAHAEIIAIEMACKHLGDWRLDNCDLYVTLEPCPMCTGAIQQSRIRNVYFGAYDPKGGCIESCMKMYEIKGLNHYPSVESGIMKEECAQLLKNFFQKKRLEKKQYKKNNIYD